MSHRKNEKNKGTAVWEQMMKEETKKGRTELPMMSYPFSGIAARAHGSVSTPWVATPSPFDKRHPSGSNSRPAVRVYTRRSATTTTPFRPALRRASCQKGVGRPLSLVENRWGIRYPLD